VRSAYALRGRAALCLEFGDRPTVGDAINDSLIAGAGSARSLGALSLKREDVAVDLLFGGGQSE
jgi:hypothetical protein